MSTPFLITAAEARRHFKPAYTIDDIMRHIQSRMKDSQSVMGYDTSRMNLAVIGILRSNGFIVEPDPEHEGCTRIRWDEARDV